MTRECVEVLKSHVSIRKYEEKEIPSRDLKAILEAARRAPTAWNLMPVHVSAIVDRELKKKAAIAVGGQRHVEESAVFLVFSLDYDKILRAAEKLGLEPAPKGLAHLVEAAIGAGIMAAWAAVAAESLGYGVTFIAAYADPCGLQEALSLPEEFVPLVGLTIGHPGEKPSLRPRQDNVYSIDNKAPSLDARAESVVRVYGGRAGRLLSFVVSREGYVSRVEEALRSCLERKGFNV
ncbi:MAG: nitroreductase family protein [Desulfurococcales archaeon]|nr:nitroreductase family protein [Desulfurococcales archaeon]